MPSSMPNADPRRSRDERAGPLFPLPIVRSLAAFAIAGAAAAIPNRSGAEVVLESAEPTVLPAGGEITVSGSGLAETTAVEFLWSSGVFPAGFAVIDDTVLEVTLPDFVQGFRPYQILVQTESGTVVSLPDDLVEVGPDGAAGDLASVEFVLVRAGGVLSGELFTKTIYVETGGVVEATGDTTSLLIFAEDAAVVDLSGTSAFNSFIGKVWHSPATVLVPPPSDPRPGEGFIREVPSLALAFGVGPFSEGLPVSITVTGAGSVSTDPPGDHFRQYSMVELTAVPAPGASFVRWSGDLTSTDPSVSVRVDGALDVTAIFTTGGFTIASHTTPGGAVHFDPEGPTWSAGESVTLTAEPEPGFVFAGWEGDLTGAEPTGDLVVDGNRTVTAYFRPAGFEALPQILSTDHHIVPPGESLTLSGSGLVDTSGVTFVGAGAVPFAASFTVIDDATIEVVMPDMGPHGRFPHRLLVVTATGSTITVVPSGEIVHTPADTGAARLPNGDETLVVKPGARLGGTLAGAVLVEPGGTVEIVDDSFGLVVLAEDGAVVDFRMPEGRPFHGLVLHGPGAEILNRPADSLMFGEIREIPSLRPSRALGAGFAQAAAFDLHVIGDGTVTSDPPGPFHLPGSRVRFLAEPGLGHTFTGWSGAAAATSPEIVLTIPEAGTLTATFTPGWALHTFATPGGSVRRQPDKPSYEVGESVVITAEPGEGFVFERWAGDVEGSDAEVTVIMDANRVATAYFRAEGFGSLPRLTGADRHDTSVGEVITVSGSGLADVTGAIFLTAGFFTEAEWMRIDEGTLHVVMPEFFPARLPHRLLVTTATGSTSIALPTDVSIEPVDPADPGNVAPSAVIVRPGAAVEGLAFGLVHVEPGGTIVLEGGTPGLTVVAEDGARVEFARGEGIPFLGHLFHAPDAVLAGNVPGPDDLDGGAGTLRGIPPVGPSPGPLPFRLAFPLRILVEGPGTVHVDPPGETFLSGDEVTLAAVPDDGGHFIRWLGDATGRAPEFDLRIDRPTTITARFSERPDFYVTWRNAHFTPEEILDPSIGGLSADPDYDRLTNAAEYALGTNPRAAESDGRGLVLSRRIADGRYRLFLEYVRPTRAADVDYRIEVSTNLLTWSHNGDGSGAVYAVERSTQPAIADGLERVTVELFPEAAELPRLLVVRLDATLDLAP